jgi:cytochrome c peroxidase
MTQAQAPPSSLWRTGLSATALFLTSLLHACGGAATPTAGQLADEPLLPVVDPLSAQIDLGRKLIFDDRLSRPRGISCGSCHDPFLGWGDGRPQGKGIQDNTLAGDTDGDGAVDHNIAVAVAGNRFKTVLTPRNTPTVYNSHLFPNLFWDGRAGDLVHQAQFPFEAGPEMNSSWDDHILPLLQSDPEYIEAFQAAFGTAPDRQNAITAMGAYEATISVFDTPYDAWLAGDSAALSAEEQLGHDLFFGKAGCVQCHPAPLLTNFEFVNIGVPSAGEFALLGGVDLGRGQFTDLTQDPPVVIDNPSDYAKFKVPQLRMVAKTGPYMHNGAFETLEEVVDFYDAGGGPDLSGTGTKDVRIAPLGLTPSEKSALVAFLEKSLTGTEIN